MKFFLVLLLALVVSVASSTTTDEEERHLGSPEVIETGSCPSINYSPTSYKIKVSEEDNGTLEIEAELDSEPNGCNIWYKVRLFQNGVKIFDGWRKTMGASCSFSIRKTGVQNKSGNDRIRFLAQRKQQWAKKCDGVAVVTF